MIRKLQLKKTNLKVEEHNDIIIISISSCRCKTKKIIIYWNQFNAFYPMTNTVSFYNMQLNIDI